MSGESTVVEKIMPTDLIHRIGIAAPAETIYRALTTEDGIRAWWTSDVKMDASAGGKAAFGFFGHSTEFQMRIEQLTPSALVRWQCTGGSSPDWVGTWQEFILEPQDDGEVLLKFCHGGWERGGDHCHFCNTTWGHLLVCLKDYAERGMKNPYFK
jgi:uncharacterized protein YndB with AHSA1/START domain